MKKIILSLALVSLFYSCKPSSSVTSKTITPEVAVTIDLNTIKEDKVLVTVTAPEITTAEVVYNFPKIIPGTYSEDDYGKFIEDFKAFDKKGNALTVTKMDDNSWSIKNASSLEKVTYLVNDTFDSYPELREIFMTINIYIISSINLN
jgi:predicted metalloprotease with PDZ domain